MSAEETPSEGADVGLYMAALAANWWLILALVVIGAGAGLVVSLLAPATYDATSSVYIGQTTDANGSVIAGLTSNAKAATQLLSSQKLLERAAEKTGMGMTPAILRRETSVETPTQTIRTTQSVVNFVVMTVRDESPERAARAASALAEGLLAELVPQVDEKVTMLRRQVADLKEQLARARQRGDEADAALAAIARGGGTRAEKATAAAPYVAVSQAAASEQQALLVSLQKAQLMLATTESVELPRLIHSAAEPDAPSGPDVRLNAAAGALAGLVVGILAALVRQRRLARAA